MLWTPKAIATRDVKFSVAFHAVGGRRYGIASVGIHEV